MLWGLALLFMLMMRLFPDTPFSQHLRELLVNIPLKRLATLQRHHAIFLLLVIGFAMAGSEGALIFGSPDLILPVIWDMSLYLDGLAISLALSALSSMKGMPGSIQARMTQLRRRLARRPGASRRRQSSRQRPAQRASQNDDEDHAWPAFQMAA